MKLDNQTHLLACLAEECAEIIKEVGKILRFGIDDKNFLMPEGQSNRERLTSELNDLMGVITMLEMNCVLPVGWQNTEEQGAKVAKVIRCQAYSRKQGALE